MTRRGFTNNINIGNAIQYFRESSYISQSKLAKGICSVATLSRIESGERDADSLLLETLLERLGKTSNQFEIILSDADYILYQKREEIKKQLADKNFEEEHRLLMEYEKVALSKGPVHKQFICTCKALLNELNGKEVATTIGLLLDAITCTIPDFKTTNINEYCLSYSELNIIIDIVDRMLIEGIFDKAKELVQQVLNYLDIHETIGENNRIYQRAALLAGRIFMQEKNLKRALEICDKGLEKNIGSRRMDYIGELYLIKAKATEGLLKQNCEWNPAHRECLRLYFQAYYMLDFSDNHTEAEEIKRHLKEEYQWADID